MSVERILKFVRQCLTIYIFRDYFAFKRQDVRRRFTYSLKNCKAHIFDKTAVSHFDRHYVYHPAWAARVIRDLHPKVHTDISSILYFPAMLSAFVPVDFYDYRPADITLDNLSSGQADLLYLPFKDNSIESLSCLHTIEHVGLGRYGDPIDPEGDSKAAKELVRVVAPDGHLLIVTPIGKKAVIEFNAHRIYTYDLILSMFKGMTLIEFSLILEHDGGIIRHASPKMLDSEHYACGCFVFKK